jgi:hypothetical protein
LRHWSLLDPCASHNSDFPNTALVCAYVAAHHGPLIYAGMAAVKQKCLNAIAGTGLFILACPLMMPD